MAANEYYHANIPNPPSYEQVAGGHTGQPPHLNTNTPGYGFQSHSPVSQISHHDDPSAPYHNRQSQQSLQSDAGAYPAAGRVADGDHYAENIPLKAQTQFGNNPEWMHQQTQYPPPSPGALENRRRRGDQNRKGFFRKKPAWVTWTLTLAQVIVFIVELVKMGTLTGSPIETKPSFNPMIGPSPYIQIYMGARYDPCMKNIPGVQNSSVPISWPCPNTTTTTYGCNLSDLCGFGGVPNPRVGGSLDDTPAPNQWFRFIVPIFLHGGFVHIGFNLLVQLTMGADMERMIGMWRYTLTYFASGIFGYVFGGNYASQLQPSTGCSGCLFGIMALFLLDLLYDWPQRESPWVELIIMVVGVAVSFVLGLLPGLDNFSHIGGFIMGLAMGLSLLRSPNALRERIGLVRQPYVAMSGGAGADPADKRKTTSVMDFFKGKGNMVSSSGDDKPKGPLGFFKGRKPLWWVWWLVRAGALVAVLIGFIMLIVDFYKYPSSNCSWCYRLSCLPVKDWCKQDTLQTSSTTTST
ncbi:rhomboid protein [Penicillium daleae]|uniref:Rhomboid-type serine protease n=1 Tax=Penicillium daleae TaxID=63821 RepID=A0AAD6BW65_9EURO|nr:rhomboid protein [Penicillium daleae]KAJ5433443.1 rhomboid protein [Penicillium daleae]